MPDITINAADGGAFGAYLASPSSGSGPGLVVIQEIFGVNAVMRGVCDRMAALGFAAVAPDLFWRQEPGIQLTDKTKEEWDRAFALMNGFDIAKGVADLGTTIAHVRGLEGCTGKVGAIGFCLGGSLAYAVACHTDSDASVGYYPVQIENSLDQAANIKKPLMLHIAELDGFCPPEAQAKIKAALGGHAQITVHSYSGVDHAFAREGGENWNEEAANRANGRTESFLKGHLG